jgi:hypothetical protein
MFFSAKLQDLIIDMVDRVIAGKPISVTPGKFAMLLRSQECIGW